VEHNKIMNKVGTLFGTHTLDAMTVYEDTNGLFIKKNITGMCGPEYRNVYFKSTDSIITVDGHTYTFRQGAWV
jgi:hypothetical protein